MRPLHAKSNHDLPHKGTSTCTNALAASALAPALTFHPHHRAAPARVAAPALAAAVASSVAASSIAAPAFAALAAAALAAAALAHTPTC